MKEIRHFLWIVFFCYSTVFAQFARPIGETIQINTHFRNIVGRPNWLLILRDVNTGQVFPYLYDIYNQDNFWLALTTGHSYCITVSRMKFEPGCVIPNFCHLENGIINRSSYFITLSGDLTPDRFTSQCRVLKFKNMLPFTIVSPTPEKPCDHQ